MSRSSALQECKCILLIHNGILAHASPCLFNICSCLIQSQRKTIDLLRDGSGLQEQFLGHILKCCTWRKSIGTTQQQERSIIVWQRGKIDTVGQRSRASGPRGYQYMSCMGEGSKS